MSAKAAPGRVFAIPLLGGGFAFGVITYNDKAIGMFCHVFDALAETPKPPPDLAERPLALSDCYCGAEFMVDASKGNGEPWRATSLQLPGRFAPSTRWYLTGGPPRPYFKKDLYRELPPEALGDEPDVSGLLQLRTRFPPHRTAEVEVAVKRLALTPDELIRAWRERSESVPG